MVASTFTEKLDITTESGIFLEETTIADINQFVSESSSGGAPETLSDPTATVVETQSMHLSTPEQHLAVAGSMTAAASLDSVQSWAPIDVLRTDLPGAINFDDIVKIMAEGIDVARDTITDQTSLTDLGVDSLLSLLIGSPLCDELDIEIDLSSLLTSVGVLRQALAVGVGEDSTPSSTSTDSGNPSPSSTVNLDSVVSTPTSGSDFESEPAPIPPSASVILQGSPRSATSSLWFLPDGSGLVSSYLSVPRIRSDLVVYGINSPYLKKGIEWNAPGTS